MKKILTSRYGILILLLVLIGLNYAVSFFPVRLDLTAEKRYTLSQATRKMLLGLKEPVNITVYLKGEFPSGFKKLSNSTSDLLRAFKEYGRSNFRYHFEQPGENMTAEEKNKLIDSLYRLGLNPTNVKAQAKKGEGEDQRLVFPGAVLHYEGRTTAIDLLQGLNSTEGLQTLNSAEALLEYKFANAVEKITRDSVPVIAYATGNGESMDYNVSGLFDALKSDYYVDTINLNQVPWIPDEVNILLVIKPMSSFSEQEKFKIDQYVMRGGKAILALDVLNAEYDSLQRKQGDFVAFDRGLNLHDQLFKYGVRINPDLVQDLQSDKVPMVVGAVGGKPQMELIPFPYFVQLSGTDHPVSRNLDKVLALFPSSIDTVNVPEIKKTALLTTSRNGRILQTPAIVSLNSVKTEEDLNTFNRPFIPVGMLLEGNFPSLFANRLPLATADSLRKINRPFRPVSDSSATIAVISDGDIFLNQVSRQEGPLPMGMNPYTHYPYANKEFFQNLIEYMAGNTGILATRSKDFTLRLIDPAKAETERTYWQVIDILLPVVFMIILIGLFQWIRRKKYN